MRSGCRSLHHAHRERTPFQSHFFHRRNPWIVLAQLRLYGGLVWVGTVLIPREADPSVKTGDAQVTSHSPTPQLPNNLVAGIANGQSLASTE